MSLSIKVAKKSIGGLLPVGEHVVEITEAGMELSKENSAWNDRTPQFKIVGRNADGMITAWLNLKGYKNVSDFEGGVAPKGYEFRSFNEDSEKFLVDKKSGKRVQSEERTEKLLENVGNLAYAVGVEAEEIELDELATTCNGSAIGVRVRENSRGQLEAHYFMKPEEIKAKAVIEE